MSDLGPQNTYQIRSRRRALALLMPMILVLMTAVQFYELSGFTWDKELLGEALSSLWRFYLLSASWFFYLYWWAIPNRRLWRSEVFPDWAVRLYFAIVLRFRVSAFYIVIALFFSAWIYSIYPTKLAALEWVSLVFRFLPATLIIDVVLLLGARFYHGKD